MTKKRGQSVKTYTVLEDQLPGDTFIALFSEDVHVGHCLRWLLLVVIVAMAAVTSAHYVYGQTGSVPNPYRVVENSVTLGRAWGAASAVDVDRDGDIWVAERCGANSCVGSNLNPVLEFDPSGRLIKSFGAGLMVQPHGIAVDKEGSVWVTDAQTANGIGHQVFKFSSDGKVLLVLGKAGVAGDGPDKFNQPTDVAIAPNGDIFVTDGHVLVQTRPDGELFVPDAPNPNPNARVVKFSKDGKFISTWGSKGAAPGQLDGPHGLAFDSRGRLFVADRTNNRIEIFDQNGKLLAVWKQFGRPSGVFIDGQDNLYVTDSESTDSPGYGCNPGVKRGIRIGSAKDGHVTAFIPDPNPVGLTSGAEGVAADAHGNIYGAEVGARRIVKYVKK
jgi:sugar lactone lactonase YvrE